MRMKKITALLSGFLFCASFIAAGLPQPSDADLFQKAGALRSRGEFQEAADVYKEALAAARAQNDAAAETDSLLLLGIMYWNMGKLKESRSFTTEAQALSEQNRFSEKLKLSFAILEIHDAYDRGKSYRSSDVMPESIESFEQAIRDSEEIGIPDFKLKCQRQLSITYWRMRDFNRFFSLNNKALEIARRLNHMREMGRCLNNIGVYYKMINSYSEALRCYEEALSLAREMRNEVEESITLTNIGLIYKDIGDYDKAAENLRKALAMDEKQGNKRYISMDLNNLGITYRLKAITTSDPEDFQNALDYYTRSLELARNAQNVSTEIRVLNNIGSLYSYMGNYPLALENFRDGYAKAESAQDVESMGMILNNMGIVHYEQGNYNLSTEYYTRAIDLALNIKGDKILWEAYLEIANAYREQGRHEEALENYKNSIKIIEDIRSQIILEELKSSFLSSDKRLEAYHNLIDLLVKLNGTHPESGYLRQAFDYLERAKARSFLDSLELSKIEVTDKANFILLNQEKQLLKDISDIYNRILASGLTEENRERIMADLKDKEDELENLKRKIRLESPAYADLKYPEIISLSTAQKKLCGDKTAIFAYTVGKQSSHAFVIRKKDIRTFALPGQQELRNIVSAYIRTITDRDNRDFHLGRKLYDLLVRPGLANDIKRIVFIPDDILNIFPFETLRTGEEPNDWLVKDVEIAYAPSLTSLQKIKQRRHRRPAKDILSFGDPKYGAHESEGNGGDRFNDLRRLTHSGAEVERISALFKPSDTETFIREAATEEAVKRLPLSDFRILHFAAHSIIDDTIPARSAIVLTLDDDPAEDGLLQMREIYDLDLEADLVTLSACQTGLGKFVKGEGIVGLNRAFFYAGASSVLMSLWSVNDQATSQLMERFYHYIHKHKPIAAALRATKLEMIASEEASHPFYWAGFVVSGDSGRVVYRRGLVMWVVILLVVVLVVGGIAVFLRIKLHKTKM